VVEAGAQRLGNLSFQRLLEGLRSAIALGRCRDEATDRADDVLPQLETWAAAVRAPADSPDRQ